MREEADPPVNFSLDSERDPDLSTINVLSYIVNYSKGFTNLKRDLEREIVNLLRSRLSILIYRLLKLLFCCDIYEIHLFSLNT